MTQSVVPFAGTNQFTHGQTPALPGMAQGVYITILPSAVDELVEQYSQWFAPYPEIRIVDHGTSDKQHLGFILCEWIACEIDRLFLTWLDQDERVGDYTVYGRDLED